MVNRKEENGSPSKMSTTRSVSIDDALTEAKIGWFNYLLLVISGTIQFAYLVEAVIVGWIIPVSECDLAMSANEKGLLGGAFFLGGICSSHLWGFLSDTKGRRRIMLPILFVTFVVDVSASFASDFHTLAGLRFLTGFFISGPASTIFAYLGEMHSNAAKDRAIMISTVVYCGAAILDPIQAYLVINGDWHSQIPFIGHNYTQWQLLFIVCGLPGLLSAIALLFLPESPRFVLGRGDTKRAYEIVQQINRWNNGKSAVLSFDAIEEDPESQSKCMHDERSKGLLATVWIQTVPLFKPPYLLPTALICIIMALINATGIGAEIYQMLMKRQQHFCMSLNVDDYVNDRISMCDAIRASGSVPINETIAAIDQLQMTCVTQLEVTSIQQGLALEISFVLSSALNAMLINRCGKFGVLFFTLVVSGSCGIGCVLINIPIVQVAMFIVLILCGNTMNIVSSSTVEIYPTQTRAMAVCISLMFGRMGSILGSSVGAILIDAHCEYAFILAGSTIILSGILAYFIPNVHQTSKSMASTTTQASILPSH